ncbi:insertion element is466s transposase [Parafrankia sp. EAN1pec]|nr:insertion element is466s transposase [Frankia sp. EAN1pec]
MEPNRLNLALNTVKRYARVPEPDRLTRAPAFRPTLVDPYRDYLKRRRAEEPGVPVLRLFHEITEQGYPGSHNLLVRYINQGRLDGDKPTISPRRLTRLLLTRPDALTDPQRDRLGEHTAACPEMTTLTSLIHGFAALLAPADGNDDLLTAWITSARAADLPHLHAFTRGLNLDRDPSTTPSPCPTTTAALKA